MYYLMKYMHFYVLYSEIYIKSLYMYIIVYKFVHVYIIYINIYIFTRTYTYFLKNIYISCTFVYFRVYKMKTRTRH